MDTRRWLKKIGFAVLIAEISYVILLNLALQLPLTQSLINKIKPDKFHISWENAWTWYPFRIHIENASANGQSRSQQWEFSVSTVSASIDLLPLIFKRVWINDVLATDVSYLQRPRLKPNKDYSEILSFFPPINGREVTAAITTPKKKKRAWHVDIEGIRVDGDLNYWIHQFKGKAKGIIEADLDIVSRGGLFSMEVPNIDLELDKHYINGTREMFRQGVISGELGLAPFIPRENKGIRMLPYVMVDADINVDVNSLKFINLFTRNFNGMKIDGRGLLDGRLHMQGGRVQGGTDFSIDADDLKVDLLSHKIEGDGAIQMTMGPDTDQLLDLDIQFNNLEVSHEGDDEALLTGHGLELNARGSGDLLGVAGALAGKGPSDEELSDSKYLSLNIEGLTVPDLELFQRYLPKKWPFRLFGGNGRLHGSVSIATDAAEVDLYLASDAADMGTDQYRFTTNLDAGLRISNPALRTSPTLINGTYIKLSGASLVRDAGDEAKPWHSSFVIEDGFYSIFKTSDKSGKQGTIDLFKMLGEVDAQKVLGDSNGSFQIQSSISSLAWIAVLMKESYHSSTSGSGTINGIVNIESGLPAVGTDITVTSDAMVVTVLDYEASGDGKVAFQVEEGGESPDWLLQVDISDGEMKRKGESEAHISDVELSLVAHIEDLSLEDKNSQFELGLKIPSAHVDDMSMFNSYFPPDSPLQLTSGTADLEVDILLKHDDANGYLRLKADEMKARIEDQSIRADFNADITLVGGEPREMFFDISGSELRLDHVRVEGENKSFNEKDWAMVLTLTKAETTWVEPLLLSAKAKLHMTDSRPIVAMMGNRKDRPKWVTNMLVIEDVEGEMELDMANDQIIIPYAFIDSDNIDFGAKGVIDETLHNGIVYARYKKLDIVVKISEGKKNIDLIRARGKFDEYIPPAGTR